LPLYAVLGFAFVNGRWIIHIATKKQSFFIASLCLNLLVFTGCGQAGNVPTISGTWVVTDHQAPGISAMGREEADSWLGKVAQYTKEKASFDGKVCDSPIYKQRGMQAEDFYTGFRISPESLGYEDGPIELIEVYCENREWMTPGSTLIRMGNNKLFMVWDGVFFHLEQKPQQR
jgi:hypothetical protein